MTERRLPTAGEAAASGALLSRAEVIPACPLDPDVRILDRLREEVGKAGRKARFLDVDCDEDALAACIGAAAAGSRTWTVTGGPGLARMHEMLLWAVGARLPVVLACVNRLRGPGWCTWVEQAEFLSQRDAGAIMLLAGSVQECQDFQLWLYRVAERVHLPGMVAMDADLPAEPFAAHAQEVVDAWLPSLEPRYDLDPAKPGAWGGLTAPDRRSVARHDLLASMERAGVLLEETGRAFGEALDIPHAPLEAWMTDDADAVLVAAAGTAGLARRVVERLREQGRKVGLVRLVALRPFPAAGLRNLLAGRESVAVLDRSVGPGQSGIFAQEVRSVLQGPGCTTRVCGYLLQADDRDTEEAAVQAAAIDLGSREASERCLCVRRKGGGKAAAPENMAVESIDSLEREADR